MEDILVFLIATYVCVLGLRALKTREIRLRYDIVLRQREQPRVFWSVVVGLLTGGGLLWWLFIELAG